MSAVSSAIWKLRACSVVSVAGRPGLGAQTGDVDALVDHRFDDLDIAPGALGSGAHFGAHVRGDLVAGFVTPHVDRGGRTHSAGPSHNDLVAGQGDERSGGDRPFVDEGDRLRLAIEDGVADDRSRVDAAAEGVDFKDDGVCSSRVGVFDHALDKGGDAGIDHPFELHVDVIHRLRGATGDGEQERGEQRGEKGSFHMLRRIQRLF